MRHLLNARLAAFFIALTLLLSFTLPALAQNPLIDTGPTQYVKSPQPDTRSVEIYTDTWAVQTLLGTDPNQLAQQLGMENLGQIGNLDGVYLFRASGNTARNENLTSTLRSASGVLWAEQQVAHQMYPRVPSDPLYNDQWHLNNTGQGGGPAGEDANIVAAWNAGFTGTNATIAIVDDGLQKNHPDISPNYFAGGSYDFNDNEPDPTGSLTLDKHGTSAGGVAAAADDGTECGVGVAYNARLSGIRLIGGASTDAMEANALVYQNQQNQIYNNSWGPADTGKVLEGPGSLLQAAFANAVSSGRGGKGSIYVWAGGNGYANGDHANADGYANSRFVIAVAASDDKGRQSWYSEVGANIMVNAPSSNETHGITTTDLMGSNGYSSNNCTNGFGGTSSAAPLVSGVVGLMLDANPNLTYRDVMHILIESAEKNDSTGEQGWEWETNAAGYNINYAYGFGRVDAGAAVALAQTWTNVPPTVTPYDSGVISVNQAIPDGTGNPGQGAVISSTVNVPDDFIVEHVEVVFNITHPYRGDVVAAIKSPEGTQRTLLFPRAGDSGDNYNNWKTGSVQHWGERSKGVWTFYLADNYKGDTGTFNSWQLRLYGYKEGLPPGELVVNGNFEKLGGDSKPDVTPWQVKNASGDKVKCNKEGKPPVANGGNCAFVFKGVVGEAAKLEQTLNLSTVEFTSGDSLAVQYYVNVPGTATGKVKMVVKYSDDTEKQSFSDDLTQNDGYGVMTHNLLLNSVNVAKIKFSAANKSTSGKWYLDDVSVVQSAAGVTLLPLPGAN